MARALSTRILARIMGHLIVEERARRGRSRGGLTRRGFLAGAASTVGLAACGGAPTPPPAAPPGAARTPVVVVGAGTAGLVCAYRLQQASIPVVVLEASRRPGGRMHSDRSTFGPDLVCELGGEFVDTGHVTIQALAKELGLTLDDVKAPAAGLGPVFHFGGQAHAEADVVAALRPAASALTADMEGIDLGDVPYQSGPKARALDAMSIDAWLKARGVTGLGADILRLAFTTELGLEPDELGVITMLQMFSLEGDTLDMYGESDERFHVRGGNDQIPRKLAERLGERVEYGRRLTALRRLADGRTSVLTEGDGGAREIAAERVVLTLPFTMLRGVDLDPGLGFSERKVRSIRELGYGTNAKLMLGFASRPWEAARKSGESFTDRSIQSTWDTSRSQTSPSGILTVFTGGKLGLALGEGDPITRRDAALADLDVLLPGTKAASDGRVARFHWPTSPLVMGSYAAFKVGQLTAFGGAEGEPEGNVHFAGEHTSLEAQGFMEGAAESGERAAREVVEALGGRAPARDAARPRLQPAPASAWG